MRSSGVGRMETACEIGAEGRGGSGRFDAAEDCPGVPGAQVREKRGGAHEESGRQGRGR